MKNIVKYSSVLLAVASVAMLQSCDYDDAAKIDKVELGSPKGEYVINASDTTFTIPVYSNGKYHIEILDEAENWLHITGEPSDKDATLTLSCDPNAEFKRKGRLALISDVDSRKDTITIKQRGWLVAKLAMNNTSIVADGSAGLVKSALSTNIPFKYMDVTTEYAIEGDEWVQAVNVSEDGDGAGELELTLSGNPDEVAPRAASVMLSYTDGWGDKVSLLVNLLQKSANNTLGRLISLDEFIEKYSTGKVINDYVLIEGCVVSNTASGNAGANEQKTTSSIDYSISNRTVYLESEDGSRGVSPPPATEGEKILKPHYKVQTPLHRTVPKFQRKTFRCDITGVTKTMVTSRVSGTKTSVPVKELFIRDLTDNDVYTYVTLKDVEFPVRKGSLVPVNDGYTAATNANRFSEYPRLVRDINGDDIYMVTNTVCVYRSDGTRLPYGSGKMSGVIVHDAFPRMDWRNGADPAEIDDDPTLANIGRYQIRHQNKSDVWGQMKDNFEDGFSALLTEYRYWVPNKADTTMHPSYGTNGWMDHTYSRRYTHSVAKEYVQTTDIQHMYDGQTFCYLGPVGNGTNKALFPSVDKNNTNVNGCGIILDLSDGRDQIPEVSKYADMISRNPDGTVEWAGPYASSSAVKYVNRGTEAKNTNFGKGWCQNIGTGFSNVNWWDYETNRPYAWIFNFSTEGISTGRLSMQISVMNQSQKYFSPRYWKAEWSFKNDHSEEADKDWHLIGEYTIPDVSTWSNTLFSSTVGFKQLDFSLPLEILGHDNVYIRLCPVNDLCSDGVDYANANIIDGDAPGVSVLEYFAIRYNK